VAVELDVAASTFSRLIKGESDLTPEMALRISKAFACYLCTCYLITKLTKVLFVQI
jgi:hypothetical protein